MQARRVEEGESRSETCRFGSVQICVREQDRFRTPNTLATPGDRGELSGCDRAHIFNLHAGGKHNRLVRMNAALTTATAPESVQASETAATATTLLIFGASGDLANRLLLPGIGALLARDPGRELKILGADRAPLSQKEFSHRLTSALASGGASADVAAQHGAKTHYFECDVSDANELRQVIYEAGGTDRLVLYFALPPAVAAQACEALTKCDIPDNTHLALEKPFGFDLESARALNRVVSRLVPEDQIHRMDHFLGKSTVIDVMAVRFANRMMQAVWSADHIESVEIFYDEELALENRAGYYDHAGALVDMIQSHLLQVLAVVAMEQPAAISSRDLRDAKSAVLRATRIWDDDPAAASFRARYGAGRVGEREVPSYVDEAGVDPQRETETLAQITVEIANQRWRGVPFTLRSGKALGKTQKQVVVTFREVRHLPQGFKGGSGPDQLVMHLDPDIMELQITTNGSQDPFQLEQSTFRTALRQGELAAYGEVLAAILDGESMLSVRGDAAEECWRITDQVLASWRDGAVPLREYPAGCTAEEALGAGPAD